MKNWRVIRVRLKHLAFGCASRLYIFTSFVSDLTHQPTTSLLAVVALRLVDNGGGDSWPCLCLGNQASPRLPCGERGRFPHQSPRLAQWGTQEPRVLEATGLTFTSSLTLYHLRAPSIYLVDRNSDLLCIAAAFRSSPCCPGRRHVSLWYMKISSLLEFSCPWYL